MMITETKKAQAVIKEKPVEITCHYLGSIKLGKHVHFSDPCYDRDVWCRKEETSKFPAGQYHTYTVLRDEGDFGLRVNMIIVVRACRYQKWQIPTTSWLIDGTVGVDSGQAGIFDESIYPQGETGDYEDPESFYGQCCKLTLDDLSIRSGIVKDKGIVCESGFGDGEYPVLKTSSAYLIDFLSEDDREMRKVLRVVNQCV